jgi:phytoene dehydrogenase-like protein
VRGDGQGGNHRSSPDWDAIVVGAGHNGLTAAAYLARAGKRVIVLERRDRVGGACTLEQPFSDPAFQVSPCAYLVGLMDRLVIDELALRSRGIEFRIADPELFIPLDDRTAFVQWLDPERTAAGMREIGIAERDIQGLRDYNEIFHRITRLLRGGERDAWVGESPTRAEIEAMLDGEQELTEVVFEASISDVLDQHFADQRFRDALSSQGLIAAYGGPRTPGTAAIHLMHHMGEIDGHQGSWAYVRGGMGTISFAIADAAREAGAEISCESPVASIEPGAGVELEDGTRHRAPVVVCNADPKVALRLLEGQGIPSEYEDRLRGWNVRSPVFKVNAALSGLPRWTAADGDGTWPVRGTVNIGGGIDSSQAAFEACERGEFALGYAEIYCQTAADPTPAPEGKHLLSMFCQYAPYDGDLKELRRRAAREVFELAERHAPGFTDLIEEHEVLLPADIEARIGLTGGQIFQGECFPEQMWDRRLSARTPVEGLYLCGAATHPGGSVIGLNGRNAAMAVLEDSSEE